MVEKNNVSENPIQRAVASVSVGVYEGIVVTDLDYDKDSNADTDMNIVMDDQGGFIEIQGTAEGLPFPRNLMEQMLDHATRACQELFEIQRQRLG